jgi:hypothetical protein
MIQADIIKCIHFGFIIIMIISPFIKNLHKFYYCMVPFLFLHWMFNYGKCSVTFFESKLRNIQEDKGFIYNTITPIYKFRTEYSFII